ncbi:hypothetical protein KY290_013039 [Solanum tuberosum]|uniref:Retrotransposon gag domain-containing protein n=1 Tax=Solanum tuberosum TaxID=4113 RepID=A0ABQ7VKY2_SOLTU|nr:hypothetical protein KY290_013039 [Solanum tuberosum]
MVQLLHTNGQFTSLSHEDPRVHIQNFLEISDTYTPTGDDLARKVLIRFFPSGKTAKLRSDILSFRQKGGENLYQAWDRFKSLLLSCPHHHQVNEVLFHTFIEGLEPNTKNLLDYAAGGQSLDKTYAELFTLLNRISQGNPEWNGGGTKPVVKKTAGALEMDAVTALSAQIASMQNMMTTHFSNMSLGQQQDQVSMAHQPQAWCEVCGGRDHSSEVMLNDEEITRAMEIPTTRAGGTTQTFHGVVIKTNIKDRTNTDHRVVDNSNISKAMETIVTSKPPSKSGHPLEELMPKAKVAEEKGKHVDEAEPSEQRDIPKYVKYVKDVVANKSRLAKYATVALTEECSSKIQNRLPTKLKHPGSFSVQIKIGKCVEARDRSVSRPNGVIEEVLVQVGTLIFPEDFVILDFERDPEVPFILGRPFLAIGGVLIDVVAGKLTMRAHDKVEVFDIYKAMKLPALYEELSAITVIDKAIAVKYVDAQDPLQKVLIRQDIEGDVEAHELANVLNVPNVSMLHKLVEPLNRVLGPPPKPSIE